MTAETQVVLIGDVVSDVAVLGIDRRVTGKYDKMLPMLPDVEVEIVCKTEGDITG